LSKTKQQKRLSSICSQMNRGKNNVIVFSAKTKKGRDTIIEEIENLMGGYDE